MFAARGRRQAAEDPSILSLLWPERGERNALPVRQTIGISKAPLPARPLREETKKLIRDVVVLVNINATAFWRVQ